MGLSLACLWIYAEHHRFVSADTPRAKSHDIRLNLLLIPAYVLRRHRAITVIGDEPP